MTDEYVRTCRVRIMAYLKAKPWNLPEGTEGNHENPMLG
jgi:hypothetical protein